LKLPAIRQTAAYWAPSTPAGAQADIKKTPIAQRCTHHCTTATGTWPANTFGYRTSTTPPLHHVKRICAPLLLPPHNICDRPHWPTSRHVYTANPARATSIRPSPVHQSLARLELQQHLLTGVGRPSAVKLAKCKPATLLCLDEPADPTATAPGPAETSQLRVPAKPRGRRPDCCRDYKLPQPNGLAQRGCEASTDSRCHAGY
jgi:hypothetical protein